MPTVSRRFAVILAFVCVTTCSMLLPSAVLAWQIPEGVENTQNPKDKPLSPQEALKTIKVPEGFKVTLFAGEPDVAQPIAICFDDRGRLWVAECYSYKRWDPKGESGHDRILIFEDTDHDGQFDKRKVFADNLANLSGIEIGFDGVWICSAPNLKFIPDANRDDKPDGPAKVLLDGWVIGNVQHNIFSNLTWGPDGWLYGCHGIQDESFVGKPGTPKEKRTPLRCGIWRFHPQKETFEVVCHGTTNPWGLDFNEVGEGFFTNCVIGHLWHMIPGAHYKRMYGEDYNQHAYELIDQHADHLHWGGGKWTDSRKLTDAHDKAGGGHAHVGAMIYQGDNWPEKYKNMIGMCNVHGRRLNFDKLERKGSGYVGRRGEDMFFAGDEWFRGVSIKQGPDGGVFITDWCDYGECHDNDGVHTHSGRIYKVMGPGPKPIPEAQVTRVELVPSIQRDPDTPIAEAVEVLPVAGPIGSRELAAEPFDITKVDGGELVRLQRVPNVWWGRRARLELQRRAARGDDLNAVHKELWRVVRLGWASEKLHALWALHVSNGIDDAQITELLDHKDETIRGWAVQTSCDALAPPKAVLAKFTKMAKADSPLVRLKLASALQRLPLDQRWPIAEALVGHEADNSDHNLPLMIWYGIEPAVAADKERALKLAAKCKLSKVRQFIAKRIASE